LGEILIKKLFIVGIAFEFFMVQFMATGFACSAFQLSDSDHLVGKSYDWHQSHGMVFTNSRKMKKTAFLLDTSETAEEWTSQYGSLTFSQHGKDFPLGGMNEKGLVVEILWLNETQYPLADTRPTVNELQWIAYQLDNFSTVKEVIADVSKRRISPVMANVHYLVCDTTPECTVVEFIKRKEQAPAGSTLKANVITNDSYAKSVDHLKDFKGFGGTKTIPTDSSSLSRFTSLAMQLTVPTDKTAMEHALALLAGVEQSNFSVWNIVYNPTKQTASFRAAGEDAKSIRSIDLSKVDLSCKTNKLGSYVDFQTTSTGDLTSSLLPYDSAENKAIAEKGMALLEAKLPKAAVKVLTQKVSEYPATESCEE
jgi:penicillin V acylase-like amidase (Ntn superfamily)